MFQLFSDVTKDTVLGAFCSLRLSLMSSSLLVCDLRKAAASPDGSFVLSKQEKEEKDTKLPPHLASSASSLIPQMQAAFQIFLAFVPITCPGEREYRN